MVQDVQGVRYPTFAFITGGAGQADDGIPPQPFETFCYDSALMQARIENFNVVPLHLCFAERTFWQNYTD